MSRKNIVKSYEMFTGRTQQPGNGENYNSVDATVNQESFLTNVENSDTASIHVHFSDPNSGTLTVLARNINANENEDKGFYELNFGAPMTITAEDEVSIILNILPFKELKLVWEPSAGAGTVSAFLNMKTIGA